jgi:small-conductance mechanosensitive channel
LCLHLFVLGAAGAVWAQTAQTAGAGNKPRDFVEIAKEQRQAIENKIQKKIAYQNTLKKERRTRYKVLQTVVILVVGYFLLFVLIKVINRRVRDIKTRHHVRKAVVYSVTLIIMIMIFIIWMQNINSLTIYLGVLSAGLALALQEVILCMAGWVLILVRRPFEMGDRIEMNRVKGDVIDIRMFQTSLLEIGNWVDADQSTGRIVNIPNSKIFKEECFNYSRGFEFIWNEIPILLTFESDWKKGREIMMVHAEKFAEGLEDTIKRKIEAMRNRYMIYYGKLTPIVYVNIKDSGVELTLRYLTEAKRRRSSQDQLCRSILEDFEKEPGVNFAYPTYRIVKD